MSDQISRILIVDDEPNIHYSFQKLIPDRHELLSAHTAEEGIEKLEQERPDIVVMDVQLPGMSGLEALRRMREIDARIPVVIMTAYGSMNTAITAMKHGAFEYLLKPFDITKMRTSIDSALESGRLMRRSVAVASTQESAVDQAADVIVGASERMQNVYKLIGQVAAQDVTVLIRGESGTGKELVARAIYHHSLRSDNRFLEVNCASLPEQLLESELFGYEKGAFTGASARRIGKFEQVNEGTLFLDEIGEMSLLTQAKILRVIQYGEFSRLGGNEVIRSNVRLIAATHRNLEEAIQSGEFREDLYYRLNVISIPLPALRERKADIPRLVNYFIAKYVRDMGKKVDGIDKQALKILMGHDWPGNVRELENCIRRALVLTKGFTITQVDLELEESAEIEPVVCDDEDEGALERVIEHMMSGKSKIKLWPAVEKLMIEKALQKTRGNQVQAAKILGIHRNTLRNRIDRYGLNELI